MKGYILRYMAGKNRRQDEWEEKGSLLSSYIVEEEEEEEKKSQLQQGLSLFPYFPLIMEPYSRPAESKKRLALAVCRESSIIYEMIASLLKGKLMIE